MADGEERLSGQTDLHAFERRYAGFFGGQRRETDSGRRQDFLRIRLQTELKQQRSKDGIITVTAYDQLRYLKNKDTYVYENKTASQLIRMIAEDFALNVGTIEDTAFIMESRVEENTSLFEMIENALDQELTGTGELYVMYDDFGQLTLRHLSEMYVGRPGAYLMIDEETGENFDYTSSIDDSTYNRIPGCLYGPERGKYQQMGRSAIL